MSRKKTNIEIELASQSERAENILAHLAVTQQEVPERRYKGSEIEERVKAPLAQIYTDETRGKFSFKMDRDDLNRRKGYTQEQINQLQDNYKSSPRRLDDEDPVVLSFTNFKGGCWKSTTSFYAASYYAGLGYRVLLVDLDPQSTLTTQLGYLPDINIHADDTLFNFITNEEGFDEEDVTRIIRDTHIPNLKLIPSSLDLDDCNPWLAVQLEQARNSGNIEEMAWLMTRVKSSIEVAKQNFDIVILDGTPSLGLLALNIIFAADQVIVPVPTEINDYASTARFVKKLHEHFGSVADAFGNDKAEAMFPEKILYMPTRYTTGKVMTMGSDEVLRFIKATWLDSCTTNYIRKHDAVVSNLSLFRRTVFDANRGVIKTKSADIKIRPEAREKAIENFSEIFDEILDRAIKKYWPSKADLNLTEENFA